MRFTPLGFDEYQKMAAETAIYPGQGEITGLMYAALGLNGEAGEVAEKVKKIIRDDNKIVDAKKRLQLKDELGDVLWYLASAASELGLTLSDVATSNLTKLNKRKEEGTLQGSGDNR